MRIVYIGTVEFSKKALEKLIQLKADIVGVLVQKTSKFNTDFVDLAGMCIENNIPYKYIVDINDKKNHEWIKDKRPDIIFCFGFSQIIKEPLLKIPPRGVLGYHPAKLPQNRGRHPLIWALVLGLKRTASTFFFMEKGVDSGNILSQKDVRIEYGDDAQALYSKLTGVALQQIESFLLLLQQKKPSGLTQDYKKANYWRKRTTEDGKIDFRMASRAIYNLVRALTRPYPGAHVVYKGKEIKIWRVVEKKHDIGNIEPGKVLGVLGKRVLVKCYEGAVLLVEHEFKVLPKIGEYLS